MALILSAAEMANQIVAELREGGDEELIPKDGSLQAWVMEAWTPDDEDAQNVGYWVACWLEICQEP
jgi:hypothetical protein